MVSREGYKGFEGGGRFSIRSPERRITDNPPYLKSRGRISEILVAISSEKFQISRFSARGTSRDSSQNRHRGTATSAGPTFPEGLNEFRVWPDLFIFACDRLS